MNETDRKMNCNHYQKLLCGSHCSQLLGPLDLCHNTLLCSKCIEQRSQVKQERIKRKDSGSIWQHYSVLIWKIEMQYLSKF